MYLIYITFILCIPTCCDIIGTPLHFHLQKSFSECHIQCADGSCFVFLFLQIVNCSTLAHTISTGARSIFVIAIDTFKALQLPDYFHGLSVQQIRRWEVILLQIGWKVISKHSKWTSYRSIFIFQWIYLIFLSWKSWDRLLWNYHFVNWRLRTFLLQQFSSVDAKMWDMVPNLWKIIAVNWMTRMKAKKNTNTKPIGSNCRYSFEISTWKKGGTLEILILF